MSFIERKGRRLGVSQEDRGSYSRREGQANKRKGGVKSVMCLCGKKLIHVAGALKARWHTNTGSGADEAGARAAEP